MPPAEPSGLADLAAAIRSIERGENAAAPAPRGDAAAARRRRREAMAAEAAALQAAEAAESAPGTDGEAPAAVPGPEETDEVAAASAPRAGGPADADDGAGAAPGAQEMTPAAAPGPGEGAASVGPEGPASGEDGTSAPGTTREAPGSAPGAGGTGEGAAGPGGASAEAGAQGGREEAGASVGAAGGSVAVDPDRSGTPRAGGHAERAGRGGAADSSARTEAEGSEHPRRGPVSDGGSDAADGPSAGRAPGATGPGGSAERGDDAESGARQDAGRAGRDGAVPSAGPDGPAVQERGSRTAPGDTGASGGQGAAGGSGGVARGPVVPQVAAVDPAAVAAAAEVLVEGGAPAELAGGVVRVLGERAAQELRGDPWLLLGVGSVRVEQADGFARGLLGDACGPGDERRARALVGRALEDAALHGHTALAPAELLAALGRYGLPEPEAAVAAAVAEGQLLEFREGGDEEEEPDEAAEGPGPLFALDRYAMAEEALAEGFFRILRSLTDDGAGWAGAEAPTPSAAELIRAAAGSGLVAHCGGEAARAEPAALVAAARAAGLRAYAAAYSGSGRARLAAGTGPEAAVTLDGLLSGAEGPGRAADGSLDLDLLAVLDAPQLSVEEAATLVESLPDGARLVLSGDPNGLWSAGPGRVFADLLASRACPRVVSRTPDPGPIGELVSCVGVGELAAVDAPGKEVVVVPVRDPREAVHRTVQLVADSVPRAFGVSGPQVQVVTTGHGGPVGTRALNTALKERLNPGPGRFGGFDPGDRVVYVPAPGRAEPGTVAGAGPDGLRLECERGPVTVPRTDVAAAVRHGWAVTAHQAAASRWPAAVVVVPGDAGPLLTRSWVYTAFGRGERHLSVVQGAEGRLAQAVAGPPAAPRTTRLPAALAELTAGA